MAQNGYDGLERGVVVQHLGDQQTKERLGSWVQQPRPRRIKSPSSLEMNSTHFESRREYKCSQRTQRKAQTKWATNGPGTQAEFFGPKTCGTGVFIPVTQVIGPQFNRNPEQRRKVVKKDEERLRKEEKEDDVIYISPEIYLPKEWTY